MEKVIGYVRVSTDEQAREGVSLDAQRARLAAYCLAMGLELVGVEADEGVSASTLKRPGLQRALTAIREGSAGGLVVFKLDRLTRSLRDLCTLQDEFFSDIGKGARLISLSESVDTSSAGGRLFLTLIVLFAQWERETVSERTRAALDHVRSTGTHLGGVPMGSRRADCGALTADETELATVRRILALHASGESLRSIAGILTADGVPTKRGGRWAPQTVNAILRREISAALPGEPAEPSPAESPAE